MISSDGRYVAFESGASNLVLGDTNGTTDIFVRDTLTETTIRASVASDGTQENGASVSPAISADGRYVAFSSWSTNLVSPDNNGFVNDIFVRDMVSGTTTLISVSSTGMQGDGNSTHPSISADGRYVAFISSSKNLVDGDTSGILADIFVHDRLTGTTTRISVSSDGTEANAFSDNSMISADGRYVVFVSNASNLVIGDTNGLPDIFVYDLQTTTTTRVSVSSNGTQANGKSIYPGISGNGRYVAFYSMASNLVNGDTNGYYDAFIHDTQTVSTTRISVSSNEMEGNGDSLYPNSLSISPDGRYVTFSSLASNLVNNDMNNYFDVFI